MPEGNDGNESIWLSWQYKDFKVDGKAGSEVIKLLKHQKVLNEEGSGDGIAVILLF